MSAPANKGMKLPPQPLTDDECERLLDQIKGERPLAMRNRALVALLWRTGLRISEALALKVSDIDFEQREVRVREGKNRKARIAYVDEPAIRHLRAWITVRAAMGLNGRQALFCSVANGSKGKSVRKPGAPMDPAYVRRLLPKLATKAGIDKRVHPHGLRHTNAYALAYENQPIALIQAHLGHSSPVTTTNYIASMAPAERIKLMRERRIER